MPENLERTIHPRDRTTVMLTYLAAIIPLFGILVAGLIYLYHQERSRTIVFHAKQAIAGQAVLLFFFVVILLFHLFALLVNSISPTLGWYLLRFDNAVLWLTFLCYVGWCGWYVWWTLDGYDMEYPLIGPRLRDRAEE